MSQNAVKEIERAIGALSRREIEELYVWLEQHYPHPFDARIESDLAAGRLDSAIERALDDEKRGGTRPL
jgi:hypothetical protein